MDYNGDDFEDANAASAAEIAYLKKLDADQKDSAFEGAAGGSLLEGPPSILDQIMSKNKTLPFMDNFMKLSIEDLKACQYNPGGAQGPYWTLNVNDSLCLQLRLVWLQGDVVHDKPDCFYLQDMSNSTCKVIKTPTTTQSANWLAPGKCFKNKIINKAK